jgi:Ca2+/Na+ antiporter
MNNFVEWVKGVYLSIAELGFEYLVLITFCALGAVFVATLIACAVSVKVRYADKKPFFYLVNAFTALALSMFTVDLQLENAVGLACIYWFVGYVLYGIICAVARSTKPVEAQPATFVNVPIGGVKEMRGNVPAVKSSVRLEHAISITEKLLAKPLAKGDRQELEKMKTTLTILKVKENLSPQEGEILNDNFNVLLKLMARYNL